MLQTDKQLLDTIDLVVEARCSWYCPVTLEDILAAASKPDVSPAQFERVVSAACELYGIRRVVPKCVSLKRLETFFSREGRETAVAVRMMMRVGFERRRGVHVSHDVAKYLERVLQAAGESGLCGVENLCPELPHVWYLNAGDPYVTTLIYNSETHRWSLDCWDNIVERAGL